MASRILGMGDVLTLVERAQENIDRERAQELERKIRKATFNLEDFLEQLHQVNRMGPLSQVMEMIPGMSSLTRKMSPEDLDEKHMKKMEAIMYSMTLKERRTPDILNGSRRAAHSQRQRHLAPGSESASQPVPPDAEADEADVLREAAPQPDGDVPLATASPTPC